MVEKKMLLYFFCFIIVLAPWLFLLEVFPVPYYKINVGNEVILEVTMLLAVFFQIIFLRKELVHLNPKVISIRENKKNGSKNKKKSGSSHARRAEKCKNSRVIVKLLLTGSVITFVLLGIILIVIGISFLL
ncbi:hypothetical protein [Sinanaerobacter chloroacetimidivorans]|uniref:DUF3899 domain-containing protein n=1 Tax=Sinanaerobacter chloroacetimidivorans TaxID=2818044 RepID=A0A8J7W0U6_9FIRM|nr:hypothetical protein [Sinanaerobacter chloroacetimidivorans]MBR0598712.1 hypothetical protein [Sinanaerobacter chloroacetimidivorans]